MHRTTK